MFYRMVIGEYCNLYLIYSFPLQPGKKSKNVENSTGGDDLYEMVLRSQVS